MLTKKPEKASMIRKTLLSLNCFNCTNDGEISRVFFFVILELFYSLTISCLAFFAIHISYKLIYVVPDKRCLIGGRGIMDIITC